MIYAKIMPVVATVFPAMVNSMQHDIGLKLLEYALLKEYGIKLSDCHVIKNEHGKPYLEEYPEIFFNISHCKRVVVCTLGQAPVGIDVEADRECREALMERILCDREIHSISDSDNDIKWEFLKYWTLKECYGKAIGRGLCYDLKAVAFLKDKKDYKETWHCSDSDFKVWQQILEISGNGEETGNKGAGNNRIILSVCRKQTAEFNESIVWIN